VRTGKKELPEQKRARFKEQFGLDDNSIGIFVEDKDLSEYFEKTSGKGVLATSDGTGKVDVAVYSRPHFVDEDNVAFIMANYIRVSAVAQSPQPAAK
jgi:hypothetical protein